MEKELNIHGLSIPKLLLSEPLNQASPYLAMWLEVYCVQMNKLLLMEQSSTNKLIEVPIDAHYILTLM